MSSTTSESGSAAKSRPGIRVSAAQLEVLSGWASGADLRLQKRARIILLAAEGKSADMIGRELQFAVPTVYKWCRRFDKRGPNGLADLPRSGQPHRLSKPLREEIVRITTEERPPRGSRWTIRLAARHLGVTQHQIRKVWSDAGLRPHELARVADEGSSGSVPPEGDRARAPAPTHEPKPLLGLQRARDRAQGREVSPNQV